MTHDDAPLLRDHGIKPSAQRVAVASYVLHTHDHPSAEEVFARVRKRFPMVSRGTIYNTLNLFVEKGLLRGFSMTGGHAVFDANVTSHHHFIDERTGRIYDVPWNEIRVSDVSKLGDFEVSEYQVVLRGRKRNGRKRRKTE
ncbi:MAG TPA: transcriptional repressor [Vicinamibacteria bacterium]|nr:transcriptional repressor [Vicinamibacteria bacterium]